MNNSSIDKMLETVKTIFTATMNVVNDIQDGKRMQIKDMAEAVATSLSMEAKHVLAFVNHFAHNCLEVGYVTRGKNGGFIKGQKPVKVEKIAKVVIPVVNDTDTSTEVEATEEIAA